MRRREEFYCDEAGGGCGKYFITYLRDNMTGNYSIQCPNCSHIHYRFIKEGLVTKDRHNHRTKDCEVLIGLASTLRDTPWHTDPTFLRQQLMVVR